MGEEEGKERVVARMARDDLKGNQVNQTGLYWPGKRTEVERVILPFQTVETLNESKADRDELTLFRQKGEPAPGWRNKLMWGDNKCIMASLLPEFTGKINLIHIGPPYIRVEPAGSLKPILVGSMVHMQVLPQEPGRFVSYFRQIANIRRH